MPINWGVHKDVVHIYNRMLLSHKKKKIPFIETWIEFEIIMLMWDNDKYQMIAALSGIWKNDTSKIIYRLEIDSFLSSSPSFFSRANCLSWAFLWIYFTTWEALLTSSYIYFYETRSTFISILRNSPKGKTNISLSAWSGYFSRVSSCFVRHYDGTLPRVILNHHIIKQNKNNMTLQHPLPWVLWKESRPSYPLLPLPLFPPLEGPSQPFCCQCPSPPLWTSFRGHPHTRGRGELFEMLIWGKTSRKVFHLPLIWT